MVNLHSLSRDELIALHLKKDAYINLCNAALHKMQSALYSARRRRYELNNYCTAQDIKIKILLSRLCQNNRKD